VSGWFPWFDRVWFRYPVARRVHATWAGSSYVYARRNGRVVKFWTHKGACAFADKLNAELPTSHGAGVESA
jgi:hypothetical protein